jgi:hypothetical protein
LNRFLRVAKGEREDRRDHKAFHILVR